MQPEVPDARQVPGHQPSTASHTPNCGPRVPLTHPRVVPATPALSPHPRPSPSYQTLPSRSLAPSTTLQILSASLPQDSATLRVPSKRGTPPSRAYPPTLFPQTPRLPPAPLPLHRHSSCRSLTLFPRLFRPPDAPQDLPPQHCVPCAQPRKSPCLPSQNGIESALRTLGPAAPYLGPKAPTCSHLSGVEELSATATVVAAAEQKITTDSDLVETFFLFRSVARVAAGPARTKVGGRRHPPGTSRASHASKARPAPRAGGPPGAINEPVVRGPSPLSHGPVTPAGEGVYVQVHGHSTAAGQPGHARCVVLRSHSPFFHVQWYIIGVFRRPG